MAKRLERKRILEDSQLFDIDRLLDRKTPEQVIMELRSVESEYERDIMLYDKLVEFEIVHPDYEITELYLRVYRWESDAELKKRQDAADQREAKSRERAANKQTKAEKLAAEERALYEKLKQKSEQNQ
jgi:hypothetical protein